MNARLPSSYPQIPTPEDIRKQLAQAEIATALKLLAQFLHHHAPTLTDECILQQAIWNIFKRQARQGLLSVEEQFLIQSKICASMLEILQEAEQLTA